MCVYGVYMAYFKQQGESMILQSCYYYIDLSIIYPPYRISALPLNTKHIVYEENFEDFARISGQRRVHKHHVP